MEWALSQFLENWRHTENQVRLLKPPLTALNKKSNPCSGVLGGPSGAFCKVFIRARGNQNKAAFIRKETLNKEGLSKEGRLDLKAASLRGVR